jgi:hypothetical protein
MSARDVDHGGDKFAHFSKRTLTSLLPVWCSANRGRETRDDAAFCLGCQHQQAKTTKRTQQRRFQVATPLIDRRSSKLVRLLKFGTSGPYRHKTSCDEPYSETKRSDRTCLTVVTVFAFQKPGQLTGNRRAARLPERLGRRNCRLPDLELSSGVRSGDPGSLL